MPDYSSTAYTVVSSPVLAGQQGGCKERPYGNMAGASVAHASRSVMCATASRGGSRGAGPNASSSTQGAVSRSGADRITQQQELDTLATPPPPNGSDAPNVHNPTAHTACERVLGVYMRSSAGLSVSDVSLHKLSQYLPPSVFQLLEVLGSASRLQKLLKAYGGASIRVPTVWAAADNPLRTVLGKRGLKKFMDMYGGTDLYIPRCANFVRRLRDEAILRDYARLTKRGSSMRQAVVYLSARYDLSDRQVRTILNSIS